MAVFASAAVWEVNAFRTGVATDTRKHPPGTRCTMVALSCCGQPPLCAACPGGGGRDRG
jgi:hypothetical protein